MSEENNQIQEDEVGIEEGSNYSLWNGFKLDKAGASSLLKQEKYNLVTIVGLPDSGKTTLVVSLYELLQNNKFQNFSFKESRTLPGFELLAHPSRIVSEGKKAKTVRTSKMEGESFLQLKIVTKNNSFPILLSDISGEIFELVKDSVEETRQVSSFYRSNNIVIVFDANKLLSVEERHSAKEDCLSLICSLVESKILLPSTKVQIVFAKYDVINPEDDRMLKIISGIRERVEKQLSEANIYFTFHEVAARPENDRYEAGYGVESLMTKWCEVTPYKSIALAECELNTEFEKYLNRV